MKLKKIAALALAGVMAVSMLAGCGSNKPDPNPGDGQGTVTTTGTSAEFGKVLDLDKDYVTYKDNADDQAALKKVTEYMQDVTLVNLAKNAVPYDLGEAKDQGVKSVNDKLADLLDLDYMNVGTLSNMTGATSVNDVARAGAVFAVNGTVSEAAAAEMVAKNLKTRLDQSLIEQSTNQVKYNYNYVVSVSTTSKSIAGTSVLPDAENYNGTVNLVLVTITRTATLAG